MILRIATSDTLHDDAIVVGPTGIGLVIRPDETVIIILGTESNGVVSRWSVEISFQRHSVRLRLR